MKTVFIEAFYAFEESLLLGIKCVLKTGSFKIEGFQFMALTSYYLW